jgi:hypothetical protein
MKNYDLTNDQKQGLFNMWREGRTVRSMAIELNTAETYLRTLCYEMKDEYPDAYLERRRNFKGDEIVESEVKTPIRRPRAEYSNCITGDKLVDKILNR